MTKLADKVFLKVTNTNRKVQTTYNYMAYMIMISVWKESTRKDLKDLRTGESQKRQHTCTGKHNEPFETRSRNWESFPLSVLKEGPQYRLNRLEQSSSFKT